MRVLAIRGRNLASLAGDFSIDFEAPPLADAGIFAITGPTGAGKSTLLDAMCLALYNRVPRLSAAPKRGKVGSEADALSATDSRGLLRQGTTDGYAEIDFVARDKNRYRARWAVSRARTGTLKQVEQSLVSLDSGDRIGGTRTETLAEIEMRVGLTAEQFGRAVMLAQGDFEAFIKAEADERAELLEQLTGTEIYSRLGIAASVKAADLRENIAIIQQRLDAQGGLSDEARANAETRLGEARAAQEAARAARSALERDRDWYAQLTSLQSRLADAESTLVSAQSQRVAAEGRRQALQRRRTAASFVPRWRAVAELHARAVATQGELVRLTALKTEHKAHADTALGGERSAAAAAATARSALEEARPTLEAARAVDRQITSAAQALIPLLADSERLSSAAALANRAHDGAVAAHAARLQERALTANWLENASVREPVAARSTEILADLAEFAENEARLGRVAEQKGEAERRFTEAEQASALANDLLKRAQGQREEADSKVLTALAAAPTDGALEGLTARRDALAAILPQLAATAAATDTLAVAESTVRRISAEADQRRAEASAAWSRAEELTAALPELRVRYDAAARAASLSDATAAEAAAKLRLALVPGEPCPVCGGKDHALDALLGMIDGRAEIDAKSRDDAQAALSEAERAFAVETDRIAMANSRLERLADEGVDAASGLTAAHTALEQANSALGQAALVAGIIVEDVRATHGQVETQLATIDEQRIALTQTVVALRTARNDADQARRSLDAAMTDATRVAEAMRDAGGVTQALVIQADALKRELARSATALDRHLSPLFDWRAARDPALRLDQLLEEWHDHQRTLVQTDAALPELLQQVQTSEIAKVRAVDAAEQATRAADQARSAHETLVSERATLLGGEASDSAAARFEASVLGTETAASLARTEAEAARSTLVSAAAQVEACAQQARSAADTADLQGRSLAERLQVVGLSEAEVASEADAPEEALEEEARALSALDDGVTAATSSTATRAEDVATHHATGAPALFGEALALALAEAGVTEASVSEAAAEAEAVIRQDRRARAQASVIRQELEEARTSAQVWFRLDELIGDREGRKFRRFAQGLTLDRLILHANARLVELKPRYSLERRQDGEMLIQVVDNDLGGEVRGLHNLSGGERFLVSLALALGLSEMSTGQGLSIESLFIDEGFGALDSASLGQAISMLEGLHAAGRRVGVISHIEEVKERIPVKIAVTPAARGRSVVTVESD